MFIKSPPLQLALLTQKERPAFGGPSEFQYVS